MADAGLWGVVIGGVAGIAGVQELLLGARAMRLSWLVRGLQKRETLRSRQQVEELAREIAAVSPELSAAAQRMAEGAGEAGGTVLLAQPAAELFAGARLRTPRGPVLLPDALLGSVPALLALIGVLAGIAGLSSDLAGGATLEAGLADALRPAAWGLIAAAALLVLGRWSVGASFVAVDRLVRWVDTHISIGGGRGGGGNKAVQQGLQQTAAALQSLLRFQEQAATAAAAAAQAGGEAPIRALPAPTPGAPISVSAPTLVPAFGSDEIVSALKGSLSGVEALLGELRGVAAEMQRSNAPLREGVGALREAGEGMRAALPALQAAAAGHQQARELLDTSARALSSSAEGYLKAGDVLREVVGELRAAQHRQAEQAASWHGSVEDVGRMLSALGPAMRDLRQGTEAMDNVLRPAANAAGALLQASERLERVLPAMQGAAEGYTQARGALETAANALSRGTEGYLKAGDLVRETVAEMRAAQAGQGEVLERWRASMAPVLTLGADLRQVTTDLRQGAEQMSAVARPAADAAGSLLQASERLERVLPAMQGAAEGYGQVRAALEATAGLLQDTSAGLSRFNAEQGGNLALWRDATVQLSGIMGSMKQTAGDLATVAAHVEQTTGPTQAAAAAFSQAAASLNEALPRMETVLSANSDIRESLRDASAILSDGVRGYQAAAALIGALVERLQQAHEQAIARIRVGIDEALIGALSASTQEMRAVSAAQVGQLQAWQDTLARFAPALQELRGSAVSLEGLSARFQEAAQPAAEAAAAFRESAHRLTALFPRIEHATDGYDRINQALATSAGALDRSGERYAQAGERLQALIQEMDNTFKLQIVSSREMKGALEKAGAFVEAIGPASERMQQAAVGLHDASDRTAGLVGTIREAVGIQDDAIGKMKDTAGTVLEALHQQSAQRSNLLLEMDHLQQTLQGSVDVITNQLPKSVDQTLIQFDAALGEGVARLGSAIERLRESMDDLQERLETIMEPGKR